MIEVVISTTALQSIQNWADDMSNEEGWWSTPNIQLRQSISPVEMRPLVQASIGSESQMFWADSGEKI